MSNLDPERTPVIVGVGQVVERNDIVSSRDLMERAAWQALDDAGGFGPHIDRLIVVNVLHDDFPRPATAVALRLGLDLDKVSCEGTSIGGNTPQALVTRVAREIAEGKDQSVLIVGAEALASKKRGTTGADPDADADADTDADEVVREGPAEPKIGEDRFGLSEAETSIRLYLPIHVYPLFESVMAHAAGRSFAEQRSYIAEFMARATSVAAKHPIAWFPTEATPEELATVTPENRLTAEPYTLRMNSIWNLDQGAALAVCSLAKARELGAEGKAIFVWSGADTTDVWAPVQRPELGVSPGIRAAGQGALAAAGVGIDDIDHLDFYSCFPSAVQAGADALGVAIDDHRGLTVTGGLAYFGGPGNNYVTHSIATMVGRLRDGGGLGLCTGLGWLITKHAVGIYGAEPPPNGFLTADTTEAQAAIDATEVPYTLEASGEATVVASTVIYNREGEATSVPVYADLPDGQRIAANAVDGIMAGLAGRSLVGERITLVGTDPLTFTLS